MFLDRLESGLLLFQTPRGLVPVELTFWQRVYLLWTFRNFRRLSPPLLNHRQVALINNLAIKNAGVVSNSYDPFLVIGVVENFVLPARRTDAPAIVPIQASPVPKPDIQPVTQKEHLTEKKEPEKEREEKEKVETKSVALPPQPDPVSSLSPSIASPKERTAEKITPEEIVTEEITPQLTTSRQITSRLKAYKLVASKLTPSRLLPPRFAKSFLTITAGVLCLGIIAVTAWHRMQFVPNSEARNPIQRIGSITSTNPAQSIPAQPNSSQSIPAKSDSSERSQPPAIAANPPVPIVPPAPATMPASAPPPAEAAVERVPLNAPPPTASSSVTPAAKLVVDLPSPKPVRVHAAASTSHLPLARPDSGIPATRPPLRFVYPAYSDLHARSVVALTADVDPDGTVRTVRIISGNRALAAAAVRAVRQWRYRPFLKDGQSVPTETNIVITFFPDDAVSMSYPRSIGVSR